MADNELEVKPGTQGQTPAVLDPSQTANGPDAPDGGALIKEGPSDKKKREDAERVANGGVTNAEKKAKEEEAAAAAAKAKADEEAADAEDQWNGEYADMGNEAGNDAIEMLKEKGVDAKEANNIFAAALKSGDLKDVKWDLLEAKVGKATAKVIRGNIERYHADVIEQDKKLTEDIHAHVGGKDNWDKVVAWARKKEGNDPAFKKELDDIRRGLAMGGRYGKTAAADVVALYEADPKNKGLGISKLVKGDGPAAEVTDPLTKAGYLDAVKKARAAGAGPNEIAALQLRRKAGMAKGI